MVGFIVNDLSEDTSLDWEGINDRSEKGSLYHGLKWIRTLEQDLGYRPHCFLVYRNEEPVALCPLFEREIKGFRGLSTLPQTDLSYLLISGGPDPELVGLIVTKAFEIAKEEGSAFLTLSYSSPDIMEAFVRSCNKKWTTLPHATNGHMYLNMEELSPNDVWNKAFTHKGHQRGYIKRFEEAGYTTRATSSPKDLDVFYEHYSKNLSSMGATPYERRHFDHLFKIFSPDEIRMTMLEKDGQMLASQITLFHPPRRTAYLRYLAVNKDPQFMHGFHRRAAIPIEWELINHAYGQGYRSVSFGGTPLDPRDPSYQIKAGFGCRFETIQSSITLLSTTFRTLYKINKKWTK